jgi:hypothetical protein
MVSGVVTQLVTQRSLPQTSKPWTAARRLIAGRQVRSEGQCPRGKSDMNTQTPNTSNAERPSADKRLRRGDATIFAAVITILATIALFVASSTTTGHERDHDVKQQLVESVGVATSDAISAAREIGSGEIIHEATPSQPAAAVIQQRSDQALQDWRQKAELAQIEIDTYFQGQAKKELDTAWTDAAKMVENLIIISGQVDNRAQYVNRLRNSLALRGFSLANQQWTTLKVSPVCYVSNSCTTNFHADFTAACEQLAQDIQTYLLSDLMVKIQHQNTIFQPWICAHSVVCNL